MINLNEIIPKKTIAAFELILNQNNQNLKKWLEKLALNLGILIVFSVVVMLQLKIAFIEQVIVFELIGFIAINYFWQFFLFENRKRKIEDSMPELLLQLSLFPNQTPLTQIMNYISKNKISLIARDFEIALNEIEKGLDIKKALISIKEKNKSLIIDKVIELMILNHESGRDFSDIYKEMAENLLSMQELLRERNASLLIEKYTLLIAGSLLVPLVLGLISGLTSKLDFSGLEEIGFQASSVASKAIQENALLGNQIYLIEYSLIAGFFVALIEGKPKKFILYAIIMLPVSLGTYFLAKNFF